MSRKSWTLLDSRGNIRLDPFIAGPDDVGGEASGYAVRQRRLSGGLRDGVDLVEVDAGRLRLALLPTRGMGIWKAWIDGREIGWHSPVQGPVHPHWVPLADSSGLGWLDGFDELLCRCGLESNGAPEFDDRGRLTYPLHGRIANRPAERLTLEIDGQSGRIVLTGTVSETRFLVGNLELVSQAILHTGETSVRIIDRVVNRSAVAGECQLLYHINFGPPLLDAGAKIVAPVQRLVPRNARAAEGINSWDSYSAEEPGFVEQVYFALLHGDENQRTKALLKNAHGNLGVTLGFSLKTLPYFTLWKNTGRSSDGYVTGLEPGTNFPNPRSFEKQQGRVVEIPAGESVEFDLTLDFHPDSKSVAKAETEVISLRGSQEPEIFPQPRPDWCA